MTRRVWIAICVMMLVGIAAYSNCFHGVFVYDDRESIRDNEHIRSLWPLSESMSLAFINGGQTVARRPILSFTFALNYFFLGPDPTGYHLVNLAIHLAAGLLLFGIVRRTLGLERWRKTFDRPVDVALVISLIWLVHPLQTESVTYLVQRAESLMGMLYLLTLYCSLRGFQSGLAWCWYLAAALACSAGMAVKEVMVTAPILVFLYDGTFVSNSFRSAWQIRWKFYSSLAASWLIILAIQSSGWQEASRDFIDRSPLAYALTQPGVILYYLRLSVWPAPLVMDYNWPTATSFIEIVPAGCLLIVLLALTAVGLFRRQWYGFLGAWFFLILGPSSSFVALRQNLEEHRMYLSLAAVVVLFVVAGEQLLRRILVGRSAATSQFVRVMISATIVVLFSAATIRRNADYHDEIALWQDNVEKRPQSIVAQNNLGILFHRQGELAKSVMYFRAALGMNARNSLLHYNLGLVYFDQQNWEGALTHFRQATIIRPEAVEAHEKLGDTYYYIGQWDMAINEYRQVIALKSDSAKAYHDLGSALFEKGDYDEAIKYYQNSIALTPANAFARTSLGNAFFRLNQFDKALTNYQEAIRLDPEMWQAHVALAKLYLKRSQYDPAIQHLRLAEQLQPNSREIQELLREASNH